MADRPDICQILTFDLVVIIFGDKNFTELEIFVHPKTNSAVSSVIVITRSMSQRTRLVYKLLDLNPLMLIGFPRADAVFNNIEVVISAVFGKGVLDQAATTVAAKVGPCLFRTPPRGYCFGINWSRKG